MALAFGTTTDSVIRTNADAVANPAGGNFSLWAWVYVNAADNSQRWFASARDPGSAEYAWYSQFNSSGTNVFQWSVVDTYTGYTEAQASWTTGWAAGSWHFLALDYDGANVNIYSADWGEIPTIKAQAAFTGTVHDPAGNVSLIWGRHPTNGTRGWNGRIQNAGTYMGGALSVEDLTSIMYGTVPWGRVSSFLPMETADTAQKDYRTGAAFTLSGATAAVGSPVKPILDWRSWDEAPAPAAGGDLDTQADGAGSATVSIAASRSVTSAPQGVGAATASIAASRSVAVAADGVGDAQVSISAARSEAATAAGAGAASVSLSVVRALQAQADGVGATTVSVAIVTPEVFATADGVGAATISINAARSVTASATGAGDATVTMSVVRSLSAQADGVGVTTVSSNAVRSISSTAAGSGAVTLTISGASSTATTGKYKAEHARANALVARIATRDFSSLHERMRKLVERKGT